MSKIYNNYVERKENNGWDDAISYLEELQKHTTLPHDTEINMLIGMYWQSYSLLDADNPGNPDDNPTTFAIRQFVIEQLDKLLPVETLVHIHISMDRPLNADDEFLIETLLSDKLDADVVITLVEEQNVRST